MAVTPLPKRLILKARRMYDRLPRSQKRKISKKSYIFLKAWELKRSQGRRRFFR